MQHNRVFPRAKLINIVDNMARKSDFLVSKLSGVITVMPLQIKLNTVKVLYCRAIYTRFILTGKSINQEQGFGEATVVFG